MAGGRDAAPALPEQGLRGLPPRNPPRATRAVAEPTFTSSPNAILVVTTFDTCNAAALAGGKSCVVAANLPDDSFVSCRVTAASVNNLRGTLELSEVTSRHDVFVSEDLL